MASRHTHGKLFQRADSYQEIGDWSELRNERARTTSLDALVAFDTHSLTGICDLEGLIARLQCLHKLTTKGLGWDHASPEDLEAVAR